MSNVKLKEVKINKKMVSEMILRQVQSQHEKANWRKTFFLRVEEEVGMSPSGLNSYYQQLTEKLSGLDQYRHHNHRKHMKSTVLEIISNPDNLRWMLEKDTRTEYFGTRTLAENYSRDNGGMWKKTDLQKVA